MRITLHGAAGEVTGSCYHVQTDRASVLVDCGLFQGSLKEELKNRRRPRFAASRLDAVIVTHAHLDHTGRLPLLRKWGYTGSIRATPASIDLAQIILADAADLQESSASWISRHRQRRGRTATAPLYQSKDVEDVCNRFEPIDYSTPTEIAPGITVVLFDAGHILGSASIEMTIREGSGAKTVIFSGDIGPRGLPLLHDPHRFERADLVFLESTYGDRDHRSMPATIEEFQSILKDAAWEKKKILIPSFSVGRAQNLIYHLGELARDGRVPKIPVYLDSPMAIEATELYRKHRRLFDDAAWDLITRGDSPLAIPNLHYCRTIEDSRKLNEYWDACVIIAGSGMCTGGRILHHFKHNLWRRNVHVIFTGYQAEGTLGRRLVQGAEWVNIFNERIAVRATIHTLGGFSAHAGQSDLLWWAESFAPARPRVVLTHGEDRARQPLATALNKRFGLSAETPGPGASIDL